MDKTYFSPYEEMIERAETPAFKALAEKLAANFKELYRLNRELPGLISKNRERREGKKPKLSRSQKAFLAQADRDAVKAAADIKKIFSEIKGERAMMKAALKMESSDFKSGDWMLETVHPDDRPMVERIRSLQRSMIQEMEKFLDRAP